MLGNRSRLVFPKLVFDGTVKLSNGDSSQMLYHLDWSDFDKVMQKRHYDWNEETKNRVKYFYPLPKEYDDMIKGLSFVLSEDYLTEIRRTSNKALEEWSCSRGFDTMIREMCLIPGESFIAVAFNLLGDSVYDKETNFFSRKIEKKIIPHALKYRFWFHQTGRGLIPSKAEFDILKAKVASHVFNKDVEKLIEDFLECSNQYLLELDKEYVRICENCEDKS